MTKESALDILRLKLHPGDIVYTTVVHRTATRREALFLLIRDNQIEAINHLVCWATDHKRGKSGGVIIQSPASDVVDFLGCRLWPGNPTMENLRHRDL